MDVRTKYTVSIDHLIARIDWYEAPTLPEMFVAIQSLLDSSYYHPDLRLLVVDHGTGFDMHEPQVRAAVEAVASLVRKFKSSALAVSTDVHYGIARQFSAHFREAGIVSGAFKDEVAAGVWLLGNGG
jgi:hypothetical protein